MVYVLNKRGIPLMPCSERKARLLLKHNKASVVKLTPLTIQLNYATGENKQEVILGVDSGFLNIGVSAVTDKRELYSSEVILRNDIVKLNSERKMYRRNRRNRKTRYRPPRFDNRRIPEGWLAPSIQHKLDSHIKVINRVSKILPVTKVIVEVAAFDIQKIKNPEIEGAEYQEGEQKDSWNSREYVLYRDGHKCQICKGKSKDKILRTHHIVSRQIGGDRPDNLITLCVTCHHKYHQGNIKAAFKKSKGFKAETFMSMVRWILVNKLKELGYDTSHTYGYITKSNRINHKVEKSHRNDAFFIAGGTEHKRIKEWYFVKQVRKCNRKLFRGERSHIRFAAPRLVLGFRCYDKVSYNGTVCFIVGRRKTGYFDIRKLDDTVIHHSANYKKLAFKEPANTLLFEKVDSVSSHH